MQQANSQMDQPPATDHQQPTTSRSIGGLLLVVWLCPKFRPVATAFAVAAMKVL